MLTNSDAGDRTAIAFGAALAAQGLAEREGRRGEADAAGGLRVLSLPGENVMIGAQGAAALAQGIRGAAGWLEEVSLPGSRVGVGDAKALRAAAEIWRRGGESAVPSASSTLQQRREAAALPPQTQQQQVAASAAATVPPEVLVSTSGTRKPLRLELPKGKISWGAGC